MERYARQTTHLSLVIYFPQLIVEPTETVKKRTCQAAYKMMAQYDTVGVSIIDQLDIFITESMLDEVLYLCDFRVPDWFFPIMAERECIVSLIQDPSMVPPPLDDDAQPEPDASHHSISEKLGVIESKLSKLVYGHVENYQPLPNSMGAIFTVGEDSKVPGLWTPVHYLTKAAALKALFPNVIENLGIPEERLIPPSYVMIFEGTRAREVLDSAEQFASDVLRIAFFDGMEPGVSQRVANTIHELEKLGNYVISQSKMVVALERTHSDPMLVLSQLGPVYISSDVKSGTKEVETWFPPRIEVEEIPDPFGPPPPEPELPEGVFRDSVGNLVKEEFIEDEHGNARLLRTVLEYAPGMEPGEDEDEEEEDEDEEEEEGEREEVYDMMMPPSMPEIPPETQEPEASQETPAPEGGTEPAPEPETPA
ncbi:hypothetical protein AAG570_013572 [Ranatra chinensis]|uniref:DUF4746 domain-containing protein n=1 Tax=Ranatra chinensis TaxID=642074 RepID=A0ABD0YCL8_9HEMI